MKKNILLPGFIAAIFCFIIGCDTINQNYTNQVNDVDIQKKLSENGIKVSKNDAAVLNERINLLSKYEIPKEGLTLDNQLSVNNLILMDRDSFEKMLITIKYAKLLEAESDKISNYWIPMIDSTKDETTKLHYIKMHKQALDSLQKDNFGKMENAKEAIGNIH